MSPKLMLVSEPHIDLRPFVLIMGQAEVNLVDGKRIQPAAKFAELVDTHFNDDVGAYIHLQATFYYEIPAELEYEIRRFEWMSLFTMSSQLSGFMVRGLLTSSFVGWRTLFMWGTGKSQSVYLRGLCNVMFRMLSHHSYFQGMKQTEQPDKTLVLE